MSYRILVSDKAELEIAKAKAWYEEQSYNLGNKFVTDIQIEIDSLLDERVDHKLVYGMTRRLLMYRFPYSIYYIRDEQQMVVHITSVLHHRQLYDSVK